VLHQWRERRRERRRYGRLLPSGDGSEEAVAAVEGHPWSIQRVLHRTMTFALL
jgi:hypothetical protein